MFKKLTLFCTLLAGSALASAFNWHTPEITSRLWKISKTGQPDSYLVGTFHIGTAQHSTLPPKLDNIVKQSDLFISEVIVPIKPNRTLTKDIQAMQKQMFDFSGNTLSQKIGNQRVQLLTQRLNSAPKLSAFTQNIERAEPWAAMMMDMNIRPQGYESEYGVDYLLSQAAIRHNIKRDSLERYTELPYHFKKLPLSRIIEQMDFSERYKKESHDILIKMSGLYYDKKYTELFRFNADYNRYNHIPDFPKESIRFWQSWLEQDLLVSRNQKWMPKLLQVLPNQKTLVAVGAAHLVDDSGLILQLRQHGYTVEPIAE
ncbi:TraB/GumN family protein [Neisseria wadsworthii]|uniref:GumN protein n=1 Tax=Neisseria wadsworthii 9715 TaxID=1030841 RepID=G4CT42_9NEIS|nr:TraB/GumN family protein [Neisseria wadsworthii]EGZ44404.1 GumN protein [Neisseria wadsworthii 9715]QMT35845.1 TraB/GumN family protein [Neisseria wadsworthii]